MVGVAAHITAAAPGGPRYNPHLTSEERRSADNGIWLCQICGKLVDDDEIAFPVDLLRQWKRNAEAAAWVKIGKTAPFGVVSAEEVVHALTRHVADDDVQIVLREGMKRLSDLYPDSSLSLRTQDGRVVLELGRKDPQEDVQRVSFTPRFPDTDEGRIRADAYTEFLRCGSPVELHGSDIPIEELPPQVRAIAQKHPEFRLRLASVRSSRPMVVEIAFVSDGSSPYVFPYVDLRTDRGGSEYVIASNEDQPIPFKFLLKLYPTGRIDISWTFHLQNAPLYWFHKYLLFVHALRVPRRVVITSLDDGLETASTTSVAEQVGAFDSRVMELTERLLAVQNRIGTPIRIPRRPFFDEADEEALKWFEHVITTGRQPRPPEEVRITAYGESARQAVEKYTGGTLKGRIPQQVEPLLDNAIDLGPAWFSCDAADVTFIGETEAPRGREYEFRITPRSGARLDVWYERFTSAQTATQNHARSAG